MVQDDIHRGDIPEPPPLAEASSIPPLSEVFDVRVDLDESGILLQWSAPEGVTKVAVVYSYEGEPGRPDDDARRDLILRYLMMDEYDGGFRIKNPQKRDHYFGVYVIEEHDEGRRFSEGVMAKAAFASATRLDYRLAVHRGLLGEVKAATLFLWCDGKPITPPPLSLTRGEQELWSLGDDVELDALPLSISLPRDGWGEADVCRLRVVDGARSGDFCLVHKG